MRAMASRAFDLTAAIGGIIGGDIGTTVTALIGGAATEEDTNASITVGPRRQARDRSGGI